MGERGMITERHSRTRQFRAMRRGSRALVPSKKNTFREEIELYKGGTLHIGKKRSTVLQGTFLERKSLLVPRRRKKGKRKSAL